MYTYFLPLTSDDWTFREDLLLCYISQERRARLSRYVHIADRKLSLYAGLLTRMALLTHTSLTAKELQFCYSENHKPVLLADRFVDFNFSHTRNAILCCISPNTAVGADIEVWENAPFDIMELVFHPKEIEYILAANGKEKQKRFFKIWTRKEAYTKRSGVGLTCDLTHINTLTPSINNCLHSWETDQYSCSVCGSFDFPPVPRTISTKEIFEFFTGYSP